MVKYECKRCKMIFNKKSNFVRHENKKFTCVQNNQKSKYVPKVSIEVPKVSKKINEVPLIEQIHTNTNMINSEPTNKFNLYVKYDDFKQINEQNLKEFDNIDTEENITCGYCFSTFSRKGNLNKHLKYNCKVKKQQDKEKEEIFKQLLIKDNLIKEKDEQLNLKNEQITLLFNKIGMLEKKIDKIAKVKSDKLDKLDKLDKSNKSKIINNISNSNNNITNNTTNNTNTTNTNNVVFQLVNYGKEDLDKIDVKDFFNTIVKNNKICGVKIPEEILKLIHFNSNYPELNNIYISDINREKCMIYDDGMWKLSPDDKIPEVIDKVVKFSYKKQDVLREKFADNKPVIDRLNVINKYTQFNDSEYLEGLKEENEFDNDNEQSDNVNQIKRCNDFHKKTYNTFRTTMYNEGIKIKRNKANKN